MAQIEEARFMKQFLFWTLWAVDALVALVAIFFFVIGVEDGSVSSFNLGLWTGILLGVAVVVAGSLILRGVGRVVIGIVLASVLAVPALGWLVMMMVIILSNPRWN
jgi:hypothetical protein